LEKEVSILTIFTIMKVITSINYNYYNYYKIHIRERGLEGWSGRKHSPRRVRDDRHPGSGAP
jgi:hypothetical protein